MTIRPLGHIGKIMRTLPVTTASYLGFPSSTQVLGAREVTRHTRA